MAPGDLTQCSTCHLTAMHENLDYKRLRRRLRHPSAGRVGDTLAVIDESRKHGALHPESRRGVHSCSAQDS